VADHTLSDARNYTFARHSKYEKQAQHDRDRQQNTCARVHTNISEPIDLLAAFSHTA